MKRIRICWRCLWAAISRIHLVDRCLILFMVVLLTQSAYSLFFCSAATLEISNIDVIVRTASASIFGYFLSANFIRHAAAPTQTIVPEQPQRTDDGTPPPESAPRNRIGFGASDGGTVLERGVAAPLEESQKELATAGRLQIIAATVIGLFCLLSLLLLRNLAQGNSALAGSESITATVAQFRDFVSGCVGFLIGCPTNTPPQSKPNEKSDG